MINKIITMLEIPTEGSWDVIFYMCSKCLGAVKLHDVEEHARDEHNADGVKLYSKEEVAEAIIIEEMVKDENQQLAEGGTGPGIVAS